MEEVQAECIACKATGIYKDPADPVDVGVVCIECRGGGCKTLYYTPYAGRKQRHDTRTVRLSRGSSIGTSSPITYAEFLAGGLPTAA